MGSADIYQAVDSLPEIAASLVIGAEPPDGDYYMPLFDVLAPVPDDIVAAPGVPVTVTGKKLEVPVKRLLQGTPEATAVNRATVANPDVLDWYRGINSWAPIACGSAGALNLRVRGSSPELAASRSSSRFGEAYFHVVCPVSGRAFAWSWLLCWW